VLEGKVKKAKDGSKVAEKFSCIGDTAQLKEGQALR